MVKVTSVVMEGITIADLLKKEFIEEIKKTEKDISPIALIMVKAVKNEEGNIIHTIQLSHTNNDDIAQKKLFLNCLDEKALENIKNALQKVGAK